MNLWTYSIIWCPAEHNIQRVREVYQRGEVKVGYMVAIAQPVQQRAIGLKARVRFSGISSFSFLLFSYVLLTSLCINVFAFCIFRITVTILYYRYYSVLLLLYSVLLLLYSVLLLLYSVLLLLFCITVTLFCITVIHSAFFTTYVLLFTCCSLYVTLPPGILPIAVGNKWMNK
jgi:hypothetical protein